MLRTRPFILSITMAVQFSLFVVHLPSSLAQEWEYGVKPRGALRIVCLGSPTTSALLNYAESLLTLDRDNNLVPCLAENWRWINNRTIEFKLREGVRFHNGEKFNSGAVQVNWQAYKSMKFSRAHRYLDLSRQTLLEIINDYMIRFTFPEPDGLALQKFQWFFQIAPSFYKEHRFEEKNFGRLPVPGPWGTGPFKLVEGEASYAKPSDRLVLVAYGDYWRRQYPKVKEVIFDNTLIGNREKAMRLCREREGYVDIVSNIRALDTLKIAESPFAKVAKSKDVVILGSALNQRKKDSRFRDIRVRKAINYAINREELWKYAAKGNAYNLDGFAIPPGGFGYSPNSPPATYDTVKAISLLTEAGYPDGLDLKMITIEAWKLEAQLISRMLARVGVRLNVVSFPFFEYYRKYYLPLLDKPPQEEDWDMALGIKPDFFGHAGMSMLTWSLLEESDTRWIEYDPVFERMWKDMTQTVDKKTQEQKVRRMVDYYHENLLDISIYSPLSLFAVNKEVDFVPYRSGFLRFMETSVTDNHWSVRGNNN